MKHKVIYVSYEILLRMMNRDDPENPGFLVTTGLPEDARIVRVFDEPDMRHDMVGVVMESDEFPFSLEGCPLPEHEVAIRRYKNRDEWLKSVQEESPQPDLEIPFTL